MQYRGDPNVQGLLLAKTGPTANVVAAGAELRGIAGIQLTDIGYDIRKHGGYNSPLGSHCGAGAPRFNVVTNFGTHFIGCASPPPVSQILGEGWTRLAWSPAAAFPPIIPGSVVQTIDIVFDEGTDTGPDHFGIAILDNIMVNGVSVGRRVSLTHVAFRPARGALAPDGGISSLRAQRTDPPASPRRCSGRRSR